MWSKLFWKAAAERAARTAAQVVILAVGVQSAQDVTRLDLLSIDYMQVGLWGVGGAVLSVLFSIVGSAVGGNKGPSFGAEQLPDRES